MQAIFFCLGSVSLGTSPCSAYHPSDRYIAFADTETGECGERRLKSATIVLNTMIFRISSVSLLDVTASERPRADLAIVVSIKNPRLGTADSG
jgi:hypothetical protein